MIRSEAPSLYKSSTFAAFLEGKYSIVVCVDSLGMQSTRIVVFKRTEETNGTAQHYQFCTKILVPTIDSFWAKYCTVV